MDGNCANIFDRFKTIWNGETSSQAANPNFGATNSAPPPPEVITLDDDGMTEDNSENQSAAAAAYSSTMMMNETPALVISMQDEDEPPQPAANQTPMESAATAAAVAATVGEGNAPTTDSQLFKVERIGSIDDTALLQIVETGGGGGNNNNSNNFVLPQMISPDVITRSLFPGGLTITVSPSYNNNTVDNNNMTVISVLPSAMATANVAPPTQPTIEKVTPTAAEAAAAGRNVPPSKAQLLKLHKRVRHQWAGKIFLQGACGIDLQENLRVTDVVKQAVEYIQTLETIHDECKREMAELVAVQASLLDRIVYYKKLYC